MSSNAFPPIFDGHNDTILSLTGTGLNPIPGGRSFFERSDNGHIDLPRAREGGLGGGFFAVFIRQPDNADARSGTTQDVKAELERAREQYQREGAWPEPMSAEYAQSQALSMLGKLLRLERDSCGACKIVRTAGELRECLDKGTFAILLHFEGTDQLDPAGEALEVFAAAGVRSVGLTHFRRNRYAEGVPINFPSDPDTGTGLSDEGKNLVRQCNKLKLLVDVSHITEKGFWEVVATTDAPIVATHSNAWGLCNAPRNLTDKQLDAVRESNGIVGLNFHTGFLRSDGEFDPDTPITVMADHIDYMVDRMGIDCVAMGSDFDGAIIPQELGDATGLPKLMQMLSDRGYDAESLRKIANGNWIRVLRETWGE